MWFGKPVVALALYVPPALVAVMLPYVRGSGGAGGGKGGGGAGRVAGAYTRPLFSSV